MRVTDVLSAIVVGAVIGLLGRLVLPGRQRLGAFATLIVGIGAALLGLFLARAFHVSAQHPAHLWFLHWHWITLAIQVALAVVGIGAANSLTYTRLADGGDAPRKRTTKRRRSRSA